MGTLLRRFVSPIRGMPIIAFLTFRLQRYDYSSEQPNVSPCFLRFPGMKAVAP